MPELPEVQTVVNSIKQKLPGKIIQSIKCPNGYTGVFENGSFLTYNNFLIGQTLQSIYRRGKFIIIELNAGFLLIHLRMTGKVILDKPTLNNMKYTSFHLKFSDGSN